MKKQSWLALIPLFLLALGAAVLWPYRHALTAQNISRYVPASAAALVLLGLYAVKSLSVCFPLTALEAAGGLLFPLPLALAVNMAGVAVAHTLPFFLGRRSRTGLDTLTRRYPRLARLQIAGQGNEALLVGLLRLAGASPGDLISLYLGAAGLSYAPYLAAGLIGVLPRVAAATVLGATLWAPFSEAFWASVGVNAAVTVFSVAVWRAQRK